MDNSMLISLLGLVNAMDKGRGPDGNKGAIVPQGDINDMMDGATWIPSEVTLARRAGKTVVFNYDVQQGEWYWKMPDGTQVRHGRTR
jgi:hypothetical protein